MITTHASSGNDYSASNAGWEVTYFSNPQFVDKPAVISGRMSTGANVKLLDHLRLEVFFTSFNPGASGGTAGVQLTVVLPPSWKDESKPPKPWFKYVITHHTTLHPYNTYNTPLPHFSSSFFHIVLHRLTLSHLPFNLID